MASPITRCPVTSGPKTTIPLLVPHAQIQNQCHIIRSKTEDLLTGTLISGPKLMPYDQAPYHQVQNHCPIIWCLITSSKTIAILAGPLFLGTLL